MKYYLDFDRTLFDTDAFVEAVACDGKSDHLITESIWEDYQAVEFLFPDALAFLNSKNPKDVTIVTAITQSYGEGALPYQKAKVEQSPVNALVHEIMYVDGDKGPVIADCVKKHPRTPIVFVDDRIEQCVSVRDAAPSAQVFLLVRHVHGSGVTSNLSGITLIHTLEGIDAMITKL